MKIATGIKSIQEEKENGLWFHHLLALVKQEILVNQSKQLSQWLLVCLRN